MHTKPNKNAMLYCRRIHHMDGFAKLSRQYLLYSQICLLLLFLDSQPLRSFSKRWRNLRRVMCGLHGGEWLILVLLVSKVPTRGGAACYTLSTSRGAKTSAHYQQRSTRGGETWLLCSTVSHCRWQSEISPINSFATLPLQPTLHWIGAEQEPKGTSMCLCRVLIESIASIAVKLCLSTIQGYTLAAALFNTLELIDKISDKFF